MKKQLTAYIDWNSFIDGQSSEEIERIDQTATLDAYKKAVIAALPEYDVKFESATNPRYSYSPLDAGDDGHDNDNVQSTLEDVWDRNAFWVTKP